MIKKVISIVLALALVLTIVPASAFAATPEEEAIAALKNADTVLQAAIKELGIKDDSLFSSIFSGISSAAATVGKYTAAINGSVNFLKLIGVIKDENSAKLADILSQITDINEKVEAMDQKLDDITVAMSKLQASVDFHARDQKATALHQNWLNFCHDYEEENLDKLMLHYQSGLLDAIKDWCRYSNSRDAGELHNSSITLYYKANSALTSKRSSYSRKPSLKTEAKPYELDFVFNNDSPSEGDIAFKLDSSYLPQPEKLLAAINNNRFGVEEFAWSADAYREDFIEYTAAKILVDTSDNGALKFAQKIYSSVTKEEAANKLASDAIDTLMARLAYNFINDNSSEYVGQVAQAFNNYCKYLLSSQTGLDAVIETYFLTHAFQFEVEDDIKDFCNRMSLKAATYGDFAINILGLAESAYERDKTTVLDNYANVINSIEEIKTGSILEGHPHYCYLTNTDVDFETLTFTASATINTKEDNASQTFRGYTVNPMSYSFFGDSDAKREDLIGNDSAMLLLYTLQSNMKQSEIYKFLNDNLAHVGRRGTIYNAGNYGNIVTQFNGETDMPFNETNKLKTYNIIGDRFKSTGEMTLNSIPSGDHEYVVSRRMINGSTLNLASGKLSTDQVLSGLAIYGESHTLWLYDTGAFFGGDCGQSQYGGFSQERNKVRQSYQYYYNHNYTQEVKYNALVCKPIADSLYAGEYNILSRFKNIDLPIVIEEPKEDNSNLKAFVAGGVVGFVAGAAVATGVNALINATEVKTTESATEAVETPVQVVEQVQEQAEAQ